MDTLEGHGSASALAYVVECLSAVISVLGPAVLPEQLCRHLQAAGCLHELVDPSVPQFLHL